MARSAESSPDPLSRSLTVNDIGALIPSSPSKRASATTSLKRPNDTSPTKQQRTIIFSTPSKPRADPIATSPSPWRIKVTLEAEPADAPAARSPQKPRTKTIKVPLKDEESTRPAKRRRRTSDQDVIMSATPATAAGKRRRPTPARYTDGLPPARRARGRPRKGLDTQPQPKDADGQGDNEPDISAGTDGDHENEGRDAITAPNSKARPRRTSQKAQPAGETPETANKTPQLDTHITPKRWGTASSESHALASAENISSDTARSATEAEEESRHKTHAKAVNRRVSTPRRPPGFDESQLSSLPPSSVQKSGLDDPTERHLDTTNDDDDNADTSNKGDREADRDSPPEDDETAMLDRSLAESEGFTMISLDSLRSHREQAGVMTSTGNTAPPSSRRSPEGFHVRSPSPRRMPPRSSKASEDFPTHAVNREEEVADHSGTQEVSATNVARHNSKTLDRGPFSAFHTGTRWHLGGGLAMGELIARSEPALSAQPVAPNVEPGKTTTNMGRPKAYFEDDGARLPTPADTTDNSSSPIPVQRTAGQSLQDISISPGSRHQHYDDMSWEPTTFVEARAESRQAYDEMSWEPSASNQAKADKGQDYDEMSWEPTGKHAEPNEESLTGRYVQPDESHSPALVSSVSERMSELIHRSATNTQTEDDIWLQEANSSLLEGVPDQGGRAKRGRQVKEKQPLPQANTVLEKQASITPDLKNIFGDPDSRPTRGKIPRTWRRSSGNHFLYSDENPSPEQKRDAPTTPLFVRDLRALDGATKEDEQEEAECDIGSEQQSDDLENVNIARSIERSPSPLKGILSSPTRQREGTPKEVRFGRNAIREFDSPVRNEQDEQYYSSDEEVSDGSPLSDDADAERSRSYADADATVYDIDTSGVSAGDDSTAAQPSDVRQLRGELAAASPQKMSKKRSASAAHLDEEVDGSSGSSVLHPDPKKQYPRLFDARTSAKASTQKAKTLTPRRKPLPPTPRRPPPPTKPSHQPARGIFSRLSSWLYPEEPSVLGGAAAGPPNLVRPLTVPTVIIPAPLRANVPTMKPGWNRNHYLLLDHYWKTAYPNPSDVLDAVCALHGTRDQSAVYGLSKGTKPEGKDIPVEISHLPGDLTANLNTLIHTRGEHPMQVTCMHCVIAAQFMVETREKGIPLLTDGTLAALEEEEEGEGETKDFPRRDEKGRVVRVREVWDAWETLKRVYGLWVRDVDVAMGERRKLGRVPEIRWPECP